ncbi:multicopper oxidase family protein [Streptomyces physcomitrii]|uniref:Multicopper oxidase CueO n=1 Tax=Streptomyces physcomitrii TaxID=2724184 RepID=A0ABX1H2S1_9ACTN|nr:multicopper oxidase family protein [Streptomyces physcomitrii]NKI42656.1 multicopper oxidase family protein [Streptomyces physcomitrii]
MFTRRTALRSGAALTGTLGAAGLAVPLLGGTEAGAAAPGEAAGEAAAGAADLDVSALVKFTRPLPALPVLSPRRRTARAETYELRQRETECEIVPGLKTRVRTFDGCFAPPVIKAVRGRRTVIRQVNELTVPTSVHLHGGHVPESSDGGPMDLVQPGASRTYTYPNEQAHANLWFHDHAHHQESETVFRGLTGLYLLTDETEQRLPLPSGAYDVPIAIRDIRLDEAGQIVYAMNDGKDRNLMLANGVAYPYLAVAARKYRFRIVNTSNLRTLDLRLSDGSSYVQIGSDGGLLAKPFTTASLTLSSGERADIVVDFARYAAGTRLVLKNAVASPPGPEDQIGDLLEFRVGERAEDRSRIPDTLRSLPPLPAPDRTREIELLMGADGIGLIDGKAYEEGRVDAEIPFGSTELWSIRNANDRGSHNFHVHLVQFRVVERNGQPVTAGPESGLKDTVRLAPGETVKVQATFGGYRGDFVYHCHMIDHAAMGMMATMRVG